MEEKLPLIQKKNREPDLIAFILFGSPPSGLFEKFRTPLSKRMVENVENEYFTQWLVWQVTKTPTLLRICYHCQMYQKHDHHLSLSLSHLSLYLAWSLSVSLLFHLCCFPVVRGTLQF